MLIGIKIFPKGVSGLRKRMLILSCAVCDRFIERRYSTAQRLKSVHFCSQKCTRISQKTGGLIYQKSILSNLKKYGVENPSSLEETKEKRRKTCMEKYGVEYVTQSSTVRDKIKQTNLRNYGVECNLSSEICIEKRRKTFQRKYGADHQMHVKEIREKVEKTNMDKYGVKYPLQSPLIKEKTKASTKRNLGVEFSVSHPKIREKIQKTFIKKYGVKHHFELSRIQKQIHETKKKNGTYGARSSKAEQEFVLFLKQEFGESNIIPWCRVNGWVIDCLITTCNIYVQLDGAYWHGLDRPINEIKCFKTKHDKAIYGTYLRDIKQNEWFEKNNIKLLRFPFEACNDSSKAQLLAEIKTLIKL